MTFKKIDGKIYPSQIIEFFLLLVGGFVFLVTLFSFFIPCITAFLPLVTDRFSIDLFFEESDSSILSITLIRIAVFTFSQALISAFFAVCIGLGAAFFCARRNFFGRKALLALSGVPLCVPALTIALSFILFFGQNGFLNSFFSELFKTNKPLVSFLYSMWGVIIAHSFYNFPIALRTISNIWERLNEDEEHVALLLGASKFRIFRTITLPALANGIFSSFLLIFLYCFFSFIIVLLFGGLGTTTLEVELYQAARTTLNMKLAATVALIEVSITGLTVFLYSYLQKKNYAKNILLKQIRPRVKIKGTIERTLFFAVGFLIILFLVIPLFSIFLHSIYHAHYKYSTDFFINIKPWIMVISLDTFWLAFFKTIKIGILTAFVSVTTALFYTALTVFKSNHTKGFYFFPLFPLVVSSIMLGFGWSLLVSNGGEWVLVLAQAALAWPFAWSQIYTSVERIPQNLIDASILFSRNKINGFIRVIIPLCKTGIVSAFAFSFAISAGDASLPLVLNIDKFENLSLLLFRLAGSYHFAESSVVAIILTLLTGSLFFLRDNHE